MATNSGPITIDVRAIPGNVAIILPDGNTVLIPHDQWLEAAARIPRIDDRSTTDVLIDAWPGDWQAHTPRTPHDIAIDGAVRVAPGVFELTDEHRVYAVPSASTDRLHQVTVNTRTGAMRCDGPRCDGRTCSHQKRVRKARAGF
jgi:hypothetical protein